VSITVAIKCRLVGSGSFGPPIAPISLELPGGSLTMGELMRKAVAEQVRFMTQESGLEPDLVMTSFERQYGRLGGDDPTRQVGREKTTSGLDVASETAKALKAFESGRLVVLANGKQIEGADTPLELADGSKVTFMRMIQVAGG
jgi:hypothetical protein